VPRTLHISFYSSVVLELGFLAARPARQGAARKTLEGVFDVIVLNVFICLFL
jgi:hypothetical protein